MIDTKSYTIKDFYKSYNEFIGDNELYQIDYKEYRQIVVAYFKYIYTRVIEESAEFRLPCRLGTLCIVKHKPKTYNGKNTLQHVSTNDDEVVLDFGLAVIESNVKIFVLKNA